MRKNLWLVLISLVFATLSACGGGDSTSCQVKEDCPDGQKCTEGQCVPLCSCAVEDECTATAPECQPDVSTDLGDVNLDICVFDSDCDDENDCTKDTCQDGVCEYRVFSTSEAVNCCRKVEDCIDIYDINATPTNPDGDPCTVDKCVEYHCVHEVENPFCCHNDTECTDENDCTLDSCIDSECVFSEPRADCCSLDRDCTDEDDCTLDICVAGDCVYPVTNLLAACTCISNLDCDDQNSCTIDSCVDGRCEYDKAGTINCCGSTAQCDDNDPTTVDVCKMYTCIHTKQKICVEDDNCADVNACTVDTCQDGVCAHEPSQDPYCCNFSADCDDGNLCTSAECVDNICRFQVLDGVGCCLVATDCDDGVGCTLDECVNWMCAHTPVGAKCCTDDTAGIVCDDGNPCTQDSCDNGLCTNDPVSGGCCETDNDCMDCINPLTGEGCAVDYGTSPPTCKGDSCQDNICTEHRCTDGYCFYTLVNGCCLTHEDCNDSNPCTEDVCSSNHLCSNVTEVGCCASSGMCNDGDICTIDVCDIPTGDNKGTCSYQEKPDCCLTPNDCAPKVCMNLYCQNGNCIYDKKENCCSHDAECDDGDLCTIDRCQSYECTHEAIPGC